jgi:hypothetical protein
MIRAPFFKKIAQTGREFRPAAAMFLQTITILVYRTICLQTRGQSRKPAGFPAEKPAKQRNTPLQNLLIFAHFIKTAERKACFFLLSGLKLN